MWRAWAPMVSARCCCRWVRINVLVTLAAAPVLLGLAWWGLPWLMGKAYTASLWPLAALLPGVAAYAAAYSIFLYGISKTELHYVCAWCMRLYVVNISVLVLSLLDGAVRSR